MKNNYDDLDKALNVESSIVEVEETPKSLDVAPQKSSSKPEDVKKDYDYTRANLYSLIEKGQETLNGIMELASEGGSPRAYEVAGQIIKSVADTTDKLMELQKKVKRLMRNLRVKLIMSQTMLCLLVLPQTYQKC